MNRRYATKIEPQYEKIFEENRKELIFEAKANGSAVTKTIKYSSIGKICIFDSPGTNDSDY